MSELNQVDPQVLQPDPAMEELDRFVGTWKLSGEAEGTVRFEWMEGRFFLIQHVDLQQNGQTVKGVEIIGKLRPFGGETSEEIHSRFYDSMGNTLDYVYELDGDEITIWGGGKGSPAYYKGKFSPDGNSMAGAWVWPGGGYETRGVRIT